MISRTNKPVSRQFKVLFAALLVMLCSQEINAQGGYAQGAGDYALELNEGKMERWSDQRMPLKVYLVPGQRVNGYQPQYDSFVYQALQAWSTAMRGQISFVQANSPDVADITIEWIDHAPKDSTEAGGITKLYPGPDGPSRAEIKLITFPERRSQQQKLLTVVKYSSFHEIGHALGITGHSSNPRDVMASVLEVNNSSNFQNIGLSARDINTLYRIYNDPVLAQKRLAMDPAAQGKNKIAALGNEGNKYYDAGDYARAQQCYEQAFLIDRNNPAVRQNLAMTYYQLGKSKLAEDDLNAARYLLEKAAEFDQGQHLGDAPAKLLQRVQTLESTPIKGN